MIASRLMPGPKPSRRAKMTGGIAMRKGAAIADGYCINSQQKRPHQQAESTELQRYNQNCD